MTHLPADSGFILIGVDGGATETKAHHVEYGGGWRGVGDSGGTGGSGGLAGPGGVASSGGVAGSGGGDFRLGAVSASRRYEMLPDFAPLPVPQQLAERDAGRLNISDTERRQGEVWIEAACAAVAEVVAGVVAGGRSEFVAGVGSEVGSGAGSGAGAGAGVAVGVGAGGGAGARPVLVGMGMPGLKTPDRRGINVINNGPRMPEYLAQFEQGLAARGVTLAGPVAALGSDADYCGLGELYAAEGLFRDVDHAYYVGCGTGIADALKLGGRQVTFDEARSWLQKSWQVPSAFGATFEKLVSAKSMNEVYARLLGPTGGTGRYPEADAAAGRPLAVAWMQSVALILAELIFERLDTIYRGRAEVAHRGEAYRQLQRQHPFVAICLERIVIGQRLGQIYADERYAEVLARPLDTHLAELIRAAGSEELSRRSLVNGRLRPGFVCASRLRAAPALGAAVAAVQALGG